MWFLIVSALWILPQAGSTVPSSIGVTYGGSAFLDIILFAVIIMILFSTATRKRKGLWTTLQPWMGGVPPSMTVKPHLAYGQPPQQQPRFYPAPNGQQWLPDHPGVGYQQQQPDYSTCMSPQEMSYTARVEAPSEGAVLELEQGGHRESVHEMKA